MRSKSQLPSAPLPLMRRRLLAPALPWLPLVPGCRRLECRHRQPPPRRLRPAWLPLLSPHRSSNSSSFRNCSRLSSPNSSHRQPSSRRSRPLLRMRLWEAITPIDKPGPADWHPSQSVRVVRAFQLVVRVAILPWQVCSGPGLPRLFLQQGWILSSERKLLERRLEPGPSRAAHCISLQKLRDQ